MANPGKPPKSITEIVLEKAHHFKTEVKEMWKPFSYDVKKTTQHVFKETKIKIKKFIYPTDVTKPYTEWPRQYYSRIVKKRNDVIFQLSLPIRKQILATFVLVVFLWTGRGVFRKTAFFGLVGAWILTPELFSFSNKSK